MWSNASPGGSVQTFLFQTTVQGAVIALIWAVVARDATNLRARHGTTPAGLSPFAWGALCGLTWIALVPYLRRRSNTADSVPVARERSVPWWFAGLAGLAVIWSVANASQGDSNNAAQHGLLAGIFAVCAVIAWSRDRLVGDATRQPQDSPSSSSTSEGRG